MSERVEPAHPSLPKNGDAEAAAACHPSHAMLAWLHSEGARFRETAPFIDAFAGRLLAAGIDLCRLTTGVHILHPQIDASSCLWQPGRPVTERRFRLTREGMQQLQNSPMPIVYGGAPFHQSLEGTPPPGEFPILGELRAEGVTDYLGLPLPFSDGSWKGVTYATRRPGGFREDEVVLLESLVPPLAMILEIQTLHRTTQTLLDTYVGPTAGRRVIDGVIKRGMHDSIEAVIWFCDLRGFTELSEKLSGEDLVLFLNDYFGAMADTVGRQGGEVLKFIGDALLAIFPLEKENHRSVAERALCAAHEAQATVRALNERRAQAGQPVIRFGLALHVGHVLYGNIGGTDRLDFTVIGQAVNVAARLESLCKTLNRPALLSRDFAQLCGRVGEQVGTFPLKGVGSEHEVFALPAPSTLTPGT